MKLIIKVDPETGLAYGTILENGEKLPPLIPPRIKPRRRSKKPIDERSPKPS